MFQGVKIEAPRCSPPPQRVDESLRRFGTVSFGIEIMRERIRRSVVIAGQVDASEWWMFIPACYVEAVIPIIERVLARHKGKKLDEEGLYAFVTELNVEIHSSLEPSAYPIEDQP